jgi:hypothetical protein
MAEATRTRSLGKDANPWKDGALPGWMSKPKSGLEETAVPVQTTLSPAIAVYVLFGAALLTALAGPALAEDCTWGERGYRACVEAKLERAKARQQQGKPREAHKTAPANKRAPQLTPPRDIVEEPSRSGPSGSSASTLSRTDQQFQTDANQYRIDRRSGYRGSGRRLRDLEFRNSLGSYGGSTMQRQQQQFDLNILRQNQNAYPRPIQ